MKRSILLTVVLFGLLATITLASFTKSSTKFVQCVYLTKGYANPDDAEKAANDWKEANKSSILVQSTEYDYWGSWPVQAHYYKITYTASTCLPSNKLPWPYGITE